MVHSAATKPPLEAKSPFDLRVDLGKDIPETDVRTALADGDMGFLHSFTTGSGVDGPGVRVVAWTTGCMWRCQYCHNPDTWTMRNGIPVSVAQAVEQLGKYRHGLKAMSGGVTVSDIDGVSKAATRPGVGVPALRPKTSTFVPSVSVVGSSAALAGAEAVVSEGNPSSVCSHWSNWHCAWVSAVCVVQSAGIGVPTRLKSTSPVCSEV